MYRFLYILFLSIFIFPAYSDRVHLPISIFNQYFDNNQDGVLDRVPFDIKDLEIIFNHVYPVSKHIASEITRKYFDICYPEGEVDILSIINSNIPKISKEVILRLSSDKSVLLQIYFDDLWSMPIEYLHIIKPKQVKIPDNIINVDNFIQKLKEYTEDEYYGSKIKQEDSKNNSYLSSKTNDKHLLSVIMDKIRKKPFKLEFKNDYCDDKKCYTQKSKDIFASFYFSLPQRYSMKSNQNIIAQCQYGNISRREYNDHTDIEIYFSNCEMDTENKKYPIDINPNLKKMYQYE